MNGYTLREAWLEVAPWVACFALLLAPAMAGRLAVVVLCAALGVV